MSRMLEVDIALACNSAIFLPAVWKAHKSLFSVFSIRSLTSFRKSSKYGSGTGASGASWYKKSKESKESDKRSNISQESDRPLSPYNMEVDDVMIRRLEMEQRARV